MGKKKKTVRLTNAEAMERLDTMVPILHSNIGNAIRIEATLEEGNKAIQSLQTKTFFGAQACNAIMQSLIALLNGSRRCRVWKAKDVLEFAMRCLTRMSRRDLLVFKALNIKEMVGDTGIEPVTFPV